MITRPTFIGAAVLLTVALAVGGAGVNFPLAEMALDIVALGVAAALVWRPEPVRLEPLSRWAMALVAAVLVLPLLQLVPLPPAIWHALPGRDIAASIDASLSADPWRPLSLDVEGTVRAFLTLVPACVLFAACSRLPHAERRNLLLVIGGFALLGAVLGILQLASGGLMTPYPSAHSGYPIGLFVNRNHQAVFLLLSMPVIAAVAAARARRSASRLPFLVGTLALLVILAIVVVATTSRMALFLLVLALGSALLILFLRQSFSKAALPSILVLGGLAAIISWIGGFNRNIARFSSLHDARLDYWDDVSWALHHYGLAGTGFGTFVPVYQTAESLTGVSPAILNHAHNDFIEIVLEGGIPAIILLAAFFVLIALAAVRLARKPFDPDRAPISLAAASGIVLVLAFSLVDYPLRMPAISCAFAVLCACLMPSPRPAVRPARARSAARRWATRGAATAVLAGTAVVVVQASVSAEALLGDQYGEAAAIAPWSTAAHDGLADDALAGMRSGEAMAEAQAALGLSPIDAGAVRTAAMVRMIEGAQGPGRALMEDAVVLGWRDPITQLWAIGASARAGEPDKAIERAEALFQQDLYLPSSLALLVKDAPNGPVARSLVAVLASNPPWRAAFLRAGAQLPPPSFGRLAQIVMQLDSDTDPISVSEAKPLLDRMLAADDVAGAQKLWAGTRRAGLIANGGFEDVSSRNGADAPADWDISDEDLPTIAIQAPPSDARGNALRISSAARTGAILSQRLMLPPGDYRLSYRALAAAGAGIALRWELRCQSSADAQDVDQPLADGGGWHSYGATFTVPMRDCPIQTLALERPSDIHASEAWLDDLILEPAGR